jgi:hypothetical protein
MERVLAKARKAVETSGHLFDAMGKDYVVEERTDGDHPSHTESISGAGS